MHHKRPLSSAHLSLSISPKQSLSLVYNGLLTSLQLNKNRNCCWQFNMCAIEIGQHYIETRLDDSLGRRSRRDSTLGGNFCFMENKESTTVDILPCLRRRRSSYHIAVRVHNSDSETEGMMVLISFGYISTITLPVIGSIPRYQNEEYFSNGHATTANGISHNDSTRASTFRRITTASYAKSTDNNNLRLCESFFSPIRTRGQQLISSIMALSYESPAPRKYYALVPH